MSKSQKSLAAAPLRMIRPNEGVAIDIVSRKVVDKHGKTVTILQADMSSAPVPDRRYSAEIADVVEHRNLLRLMFAQEEADLVSLRSMVVVSVNKTGIRQFLDSLRMLDNGSKLEELARSNGVVQDSLTSINKDAQQGNVGLRAGSIVMAVANEEACLDFYQASAFAVRAGGYSNKLQIEPVVRVELSFGLLLALVQKLRDLQTGWPNEEAFELSEVQK